MLRRTPLKRRSKPLRARRRPAQIDPRAYDFKEVLWRACAVCGEVGWCRRHHLVREQHIRAEGGDPWDPAVGLWIGVDWTCHCHTRHHHPAAHGDSRIPRDKVTLAAFEFATRLFGSEAKARDYFDREYAS